jgi:hypothetical protein
MTLIEPTPLVRPPKIPSKFDIIPIHASDRGTFKRCRRRWEWSSPMQMNLVPKVEQQGLDIRLWFGTGIHYALSQYYNPILQRDLIETFKAWWELQYHGGIVTEEQAELSYDRRPKQWLSDAQSGVMWKVEGLRDMLPVSEDLERYEEHLELGLGMLEFYKIYAEEHDNFAVICEEHTFSVPIVDLDGIPLMMVDPRDDKVKEVHLRGTQDAIIQDLETGQFGILEHKTAINVDENYHRKLEKDEQCTTYMYGAEREARLHGLEYERISYVLYNALRKAYPKPPTPVKNGLFSINRQAESTTYPMLMAYINENGLGPLVFGDSEIGIDADLKLKAYVEYVRDKGDEQFVVRTPVRRNKQEIDSCGERVYMEAMDMLTKPRIYPNPTGDYGCLNCTFRIPCIARDDGSDWQMILEDNYESNWTR